MFREIRGVQQRRGRGCQHLEVCDADNPPKKDSGALVPNGRLPYLEVMDKLEAAEGCRPKSGRSERLRFLDRAPSDR